MRGASSSCPPGLPRGRISTTFTSSLAFSPRGKSEGVEKGTGASSPPGRGRRREAWLQVWGPGNAACSCVSGQVLLPPAPVPAPRKTAPTVLSNSAAVPASPPSHWGLKVQVGLSWFSSQPAEDRETKRAEGGLQRGVLSLLQPSLFPQRRSLPCRTPAAQYPGGLTHPRAGLRVSFSEVLLMALRFMMRAGASSCRGKGHYNPRLETPRGAPEAGRVAPLALPAPRGAAPAPAGKAARCPASRSTLPWDSAHSRSLSSTSPSLTPLTSSAPPRIASLSGFLTPALSRLHLRARPPTAGRYEAWEGTTGGV